MIIIRPEEAEHADGVYQVEEKAFNRPAEADLCASLRKRRAVTLSLVALEDGEVVGHVLFSPVTIRGESRGRCPRLAWDRWRCCPSARARASARG